MVNSEVLPPIEQGLIFVKQFLKRNRKTNLFSAVLCTVPLRLSFVKVTINVIFLQLFNWCVGMVNSEVLPPIEQGPIFVKAILKT
jgi:hypothetical protein